MRAEFEMETRRENTNRMLTNGTLQCRRLQTYSISINYQRVAPWVEKTTCVADAPTTMTVVCCWTTQENHDQATLFTSWP